MRGDKLVERRDALETVLRGGVPIEGESEEDEIRARIVYDWLVARLDETKTAIAERDDSRERESLAAYRAEVAP